MGIGTYQLKTQERVVATQDGLCRQAASATATQAPLQRAIAESPLQCQQRAAIQRFLPRSVQQRADSGTPNRTGLPDHLKTGVESLSGMSLDAVKVHYNSARPAQLNALAYAQGTDIHVGPGQEKHLPHEAWHVVQQAQGRVKPTRQMKTGVPVNDDESLEREADAMGAKAMQRKAQAHESQHVPRIPMHGMVAPVQRVTAVDLVPQVLEQKYSTGQQVRAVVGGRMSSRLDPDDPKKGTAPGSGAWEEIYDDLNYNHGESFIKGHLLNANLGGLGLPENLFPITAAANHDHSGRIEENVKDAVLNPKLTTGERCNIHYTVVAVAKNKKNFVDDPEATLRCKAEKVEKGGGGKKELIIDTTVLSKPSQHARNVDLKNKGWGSQGSGRGSGSAKAEDTSDPQEIAQLLNGAGLKISSGTVEKAVARNKKLHALVFK